MQAEDLAGFEPLPSEHLPWQAARGKNPSRMHEPVLPPLEVRRIRVASLRLGFKQLELELEEAIGTWSARAWLQRGSNRGVANSTYAHT